MFSIGIGQPLVSWYRYRQHWRYRSNPTLHTTHSHNGY